MAAFQFHTTVRFGHVDAAGIVFYPRLFEMINDAVESWFAEALGYPFHEMVARDGCGFPVVDARTEFLAASRLGDELTFSLAVTELGRASVTLEITCDCAGERRLTGCFRYVFVQLSPLRSTTIPDGVRASMQAFVP